MDHDGLFKELLRTFFVEFVEAFLPKMAAHLDPASLEFLDKEVIREVAARKKHIVDVLVRARLMGEPAFILIHVENQASRDDDFPERMFDYFSWLRAKHRLPIYPVAIFSYDEQHLEPDHFRVAILGDNVLSFKYKVIPLNRMPWRKFVRQPNPVATALMTKMRIAPNERWKVKSECLRMLLTLRLDAARSELIWTFAESYLKLSVEETKRYEREIAKLPQEEQETTMQLMTSFKREGIQIGQHDGKETLVIRQLRKRFGEISPEITKRMDALSSDQLDELGESLFDFTSIIDVENWLARHTPNDHNVPPTLST
ncbi:MAG TPA: DUF4351 domain-containing protein [Chthonomonadaceae bacterium]|nr:DUF4351 domain-containing protein [Chthonomonadaceae bacterium]